MSKIIIHIGCGQFEQFETHMNHMIVITSKYMEKNKYLFSLNMIKMNKC